MKKILLLCLIAFALFGQTPQGKKLTLANVTERIAPDSAKGETIFVHTVELDDGRIAIERETYENTLRTTDKIIDNLRWFIGIIFVAAGAILGFIQWQQQKKTRETLKGYEKTLHESEGTLEKVRKEYEKTSLQLKHQCDDAKKIKDEFEELKTNFRKEINITAEEAKQEMKNVVKNEIKKLDKASADKEMQNADKEMGEWNFSEAINHYGNVTTCLKPYEEDDDVIKLLTDAFFNRGNANFSLKNYKYAIEDYNEAIRLKPDFAEAFGVRGIAKAELGQYADAIKDYDEAIRLKPDFAEAFVNRSTAYLLLASLKGIKPGEHEYFRNAKADAEKAIELNQNECLYNLACAEALLLEKENAFNHLEECIRKKLISLEDVEGDDNWKHLRDTEEYKRIIAKFKRV